MIDSGEFDDLVTKTYGRPYCFQQQDGCKSRGTHEITVPNEYPHDFEAETIPEVINGDVEGVSFAAWLKRSPLEWNGKEEGGNCLDLFWERNFYPSLEMIVDDLHSKGLLPAGKYTINIDW